MKYRVNSLQEAIEYTLEQLKYEQNNTYIIKKLILSALSGKSEYFTDLNHAREYIHSKTKEELLKEMIDDSSISNNVDEVIENYINKNFCKSIDDIFSEIKEKADLNKIEKKIRYININSENDRNFYNNVWAYFSKVFTNKEESNISAEELKNDMLLAAMEVATSTRDKVKVLKQLDPASESINTMDAVTLVDEYLHKGRKHELLYYVNANKNLSGALLQNLLDYTYFSKNNDLNISSVVKLDNILASINSIQAKSELLYELLTEKKHEDFGVSREEVIVDLLKNSLSLYGYSNYMNNVKANEMYALNNEELGQVKKQTNDKLVEELLINGENTTINDIVNTYNNYNDQALHFLVDTYVVSRLTKENQYRLNDLKYYTNTNMIHMFNLLDTPELQDELRKKNVKIAA